MAPNDNQDKSNPDTPSSSRPYEPALQKLVKVFDIPRAIHDYGSEHGREWAKRRESRRDESNRDERAAQWGGCDHKRRLAQWSSNKDQADPTQLSAMGSGKSSDDDWYTWTRRELERGEKRAKELYDSWSDQMSPPKSSQNRPTKDDARQEQDWPISTIAQAVKWMFDNGSLIDKEFEKLMQMHTKDFEAYNNSMTSPYSQLHLAARNTNIIEYVLMDEYSPMMLEGTPGFDSSWRNRFEDLLRADAGVKMLDRKEAESARKENIMQWLWRFEPKDEEFKTKQPTSGFSTKGLEQMTELDMYEHYLSNSNYSSKSSANHNDDPVSVERTIDSWTTRDGSVRTRETTRKTFADGRAEVFISEDTPSSNNAQENDTQAATKSPAQQTQQPGAERRYRGWFWSK
jgi:hypothetical protein